MGPVDVHSYPAAEEPYRAAFAREAGNHYPVMTKIEGRYGFALDTYRLERAARVLACPVKANPPSWQHGRLIYAALRRLIDRLPAASPPVLVLDIGTAKGFSALCAQLALMDSGCAGNVTSVDVINPLHHVRRNTVAEVGGLKTLYEILEPWPETKAIKFLGGGSAAVLSAINERVHFAFIDGKHSAQPVAADLRRLRRLQQSGDMIVMDDLQIEPVAAGLKLAQIDRDYAVEIITLSETRKYAVLVRR